MISTANTRIILEGKTVPYVSKFIITYDKDKIRPEASIHLNDGTIIKTELIGIDHVSENSFKNKNPLVYWTQYTCAKITPTYKENLEKKLYEGELRDLAHLEGIHSGMPASEDLEYKPLTEKETKELEDELYAGELKHLAPLRGINITYQGDEDLSYKGKVKF